MTQDPTSATDRPTGELPVRAHESKKAFTAALIGFSAFVVTSFFGGRVEDPAQVISVCAFAFSIPILAVYWGLAYGPVAYDHLGWLEGIFVVGVLASVVGFGAALAQVHVYALATLAVSVFIAYVLGFAALRTSETPKP